MANTSGPQVSIGNGQTMNAIPAKYFNALVANIKQETGITIAPTEGTRSYARQKQLYDGYRAGRIDPTTGKRYNPAWSPDDPRANHLSGNAVDVGSSVGYTNTANSKAFYARAAKYGFHATVPGEPWHFEFRNDGTVSLSDASKPVVIDTPANKNEKPKGKMFTYLYRVKDGDNIVAYIYQDPFVRKNIGWDLFVAYAAAQGIDAYSTPAVSRGVDAEMGNLFVEQRNNLKGLI